MSNLEVRLGSKYTLSIGLSNKFQKKSKKLRGIKQMTTYCPKDVFQRSSRGRPENVLGTSESTSQGRSLDVRLGRPLDVILGRPQGVRLERPRDGQIGYLGNVLATLEADVLGTSWGPIFAGWVDTFVSDLLILC